MGEKPDQIERHIYEKRNELGENINELQQKVKTAVDWRAQTEERPMTMMGLAFGGGVLLSLLFGGGPRRRSRRWSPERDRQQPRPFDQARAADYGTITKPDKGSEADSTWNNIRGAALTVLGMKLGSVIEQVLPGFQEQFHRRQNERRSSTSRPNGPETVWRKTASGETDYNPQS
jgi:hypothetical protein